MEKNNRILLVTPPKNLHKGQVVRPKFGTQPLGIAYIASYLRERGMQCGIIDAYTSGIKPEQILQEIKNKAPAFIGISSMTVFMKEAVALASLIRTRFPEIKLVLGGPHASLLPDECLKTGMFDHVVIGEGEQTMFELAAAENDDDRRKVAGTAFIHDGRIVKGLSRPFIEDLDSLPFPAHDLLLPIRQYNPLPHWGRRGQFSTLITSRGCPYGCFYCSVAALQGRKYRFRSPRNVLAEIEWLVNNFNVKSFSFNDGTFTLKKSRAEEICGLIIDRSLEISWSCTSRVNEVTPDLLKLMRRAGCRAMFYGIESGDEKLIQELKKVTLEQVRQAVAWTESAGIESHGYFMFAMPHETKETMEKTIAFARSLPLSTSGYCIATPFPGTELWDWVQENKLFKGKEWDQFFTGGHMVFNHPEISEQEAVRYQKKAYYMFYFRPKIIFRMFGRNIGNFNVLFNYLLKAIEKFIKGN